MSVLNFWSTSMTDPNQCYFLFHSAGRFQARQEWYWRDSRVCVVVFLCFFFKNWYLFFGWLESRVWEMNLLLTQRRGSGNCLFYPEKLWMSIRQKVACSFADSVILWNWLRWFQKVFGQCKCMSLKKGLPNPVKVYRSQEAMAFQLWSYFSSSA